MSENNSENEALILKYKKLESAKDIFWTKLAGQKQKK